jgi:putative toxin-antitoxin system antitoxin component (TIGR02293 family)
MPSRSPEEILGMPEDRGGGDSGKLILKGLPVRSLNAFQRITAATEEEILHILWMSSRTLKSRMQTGRLTPSESDRLYRAARVISDVFRLYKGNAGKVRTWLRSYASTDNLVLPISLLGTSGGAELAEIFLQIAFFETYLSGNPASSKESEEKYPDPLTILGVKRSGDIDGQIRRGFPFRSYELFKKRTLFSAKELRDNLWISSSTLSKYHARGRLSGEISDRLYRMAAVFYFVNRMIGDDQKDAQDWIHDEAFGLGYRRPIDQLKTDPESHEVIAIAGRIMYGMTA